LKKRTKKLLFVSVRADRISRVNQQTKVFWLFFSKKNCFLAFLRQQINLDAPVGVAAGFRVVVADGRVGAETGDAAGLEVV
jgi:hypothetical protein